MLKFIAQNYVIPEHVISAMEENLEHEDNIDLQDYIEIQGNYISLYDVSEGDLPNVTEQLLYLVPEQYKPLVNFSIVAFDEQCHTVQHWRGNVIKTVCENGTLKHLVANEINFKER